MLPSKLYVRGAVINLLEEQLFCMSMCNMCSMFTVYNWIYVQWSISAIYDRLLLAKRKQCGWTSRAAWWCHTMRWQDYKFIISPLQNRCSSVNLVCEEVLWYIKSRRTDFFTEWIVQVWGTLVATVGDVCNYIKSVDCEDCHPVQQHVKSWCRIK